MSERVDIEIRDKISSSIPKKIGQIRDNSLAAHKAVEDLKSELHGFGTKDDFAKQTKGARMLTKEVTKTTKALNKMNKAGRGRGAGIPALGKNANIATKSVDGLEKGLKKLGNTRADALRGRQVNFLFDFVNLLDDAQYGLRAVTNNLPVTARSFDLLGKSAGGARGAVTGLLGVVGKFALRFGPAAALVGVAGGMVAFRDEIKLTADGATTLGDVFSVAWIKTADGAKTVGGVIKDTFVGTISTGFQQGIQKVDNFTKAIIKSGNAAQEVGKKIGKFDFVNQIPGVKAARGLARRTGFNPQPIDEDAVSVDKALGVVGDASNEQKMKERAAVLKELVKSMERESELASMTARDRAKALAADKLRKQLGASILGTDEIKGVNERVDKDFDAKDEKAKRDASGRFKKRTEKDAEIEQKLLDAGLARVQTQRELNILLEMERLMKQDISEKDAKASATQKVDSSLRKQQATERVREREALTQREAKAKSIQKVLDSGRATKDNINQLIELELAGEDALLRKRLESVQAIEAQNEKKREGLESGLDLGPGAPSDAARQIEDFKFQNSAALQSISQGYGAASSQASGYFNTLGSGYGQALSLQSQFASSSRQAGQAFQQSMFGATSSLQQFSQGPLSRVLGQIGELSGFGGGGSGSGSGGGGLLGFLFGSITQGIQAGAQQRSSGQFASYQHAQANGITPRYAGFSSGGFTGNGPVNRIAGAVHGQEFVSNAAATRNIRPQLEYANRHGRLPNSGTTVNIVSMPGVHIEERMRPDGEIEAIASRVVAQQGPRQTAANIRNPNSRESRAISQGTRTKRRRG